MNSETLRPVNTESQDSMDGSAADEHDDDVLQDYYSPEITTLTDIEKMSTLDQLKYLSGVAEAADADAWYSVFEAKKILTSVATSNRFSPLIRAIADSFGSTESDYDGAGNDIIREEYGYSSMVTPDMTPDGILSEETKMMNEGEIRAELKKISEAKKELPHEFESGSPEEDTFMEYMSRQNELDFALRMIYFRRNQARLHREFPSSPRDRQLMKIAPDAACTLEFQEKYDEEDSWFSFSSSVDTILDQNGHDVSSDRSTFVLDDESILYLKIVHGNIQLKTSISEMIGIDLTKISLESQACLLKFMARADDGRFNRLCETLHSVPDEGLRIRFAEGFLAADFGDDFGDALLDIANSEKISSEQLAEILDTIGSCRKSIRDIADFYRGFDDGSFADEYARASNERLTDAIMVFREIATKDEAKADLGWPGEVSFNYDSAIEALNYEARSLEIISGTLNDVASGKEGAFAELIIPPEERRQSSFYSFYSPDHGYVLLYTRPEGSGSFNPSFEYGKKSSNYDMASSNVGTEASISLIVNVENPFALPNPYRPDPRASRNPNYYDPSTMGKVSALRIDREGRVPGTPADDPNRDPVNPIGTVSADLAAIGDRADTPSGKIARLFSVGGAIRATTNGKDSALNHNTRWFDQARYGTDAGFKELVDYIDSMAKEWCIKHPPNKDEGFRGAARTINKNRGKRIGRMVV